MDPKKRPLPPTYFLVAIIVMIATHFLFPLVTLFRTPWRCLGALPLLMGVVLNLRTDQLFKRYGTEVKPFRDSSALILEGPFRFSRNPRLPPDSTQMQAAVHWVGGAVSSVAVPKGWRGQHRCVAQPELVALVKDLAEEFTDDQIARILIRKRPRTSRGLSFTARRVTSLRGNHDLPGCGRAPLQGPDVHTAEQAADLLGVARSTIIRWIADDTIRPSRHGDGHSGQAPQLPAALGACSVRTSYRNAGIS